MIREDGFLKIDYVDGSSLIELSDKTTIYI